MNIPNLLKLADYLETLPEDYKHFEMSDFIHRGNRSKYADYARNNGGVAETACGAVACAIGHGPAAGFLFNEDELRQQDDWGLGEKLYIPQWHDYCARVFIDQNDDPAGWDFMFSGTWWRHDNTPWGAAARIRYYIENEDKIHDLRWDFFNPELYASYLKGNRDANSA